MKHPMQPVARDADGTIRFQDNRLVLFLRATSKYTLEELHLMPFSDDDWMQLMQLCGCSVTGFGELAYASADVVEQADEAAAKLEVAT